MIQEIGKIFWWVLGGYFRFADRSGEEVWKFLSELRGGCCRGGSVFDPKNTDMQVIVMPPTPPPKKQPGPAPSFRFFPSRVLMFF